jgi:hypothetical protein
MLHGFLHRLRGLVLALTLVGASAFAGIERYESGLLSRFEEEHAPAVRLGEDEAIARFVAEQFAQMGPGLRWRRLQTDRDLSHTHALFGLELGGRRVAGHFLKVHYRRDGWVQYASSSWRHPLAVQVSRPSRGLREAIETRLRARLGRERRLFSPKIKLEPIVWVSATGEARAAFEAIVEVASAGYGTKLFIDEKTDAWLAEEATSRGVDVANQVYLKSPFGGASATAVTLTGLTSSSTLESAVMHVQRHQNEATPTLVEISSSTAFVTQTGAGYTNDPDGFSASCSGATTDCPNQGFDGVNVYYHIQTYRERIDQLLSELGSNSSVLARDPLPVVVNAFVDSNFDGSNDRNNALYMSAGCPDGVGEPPCITFVPPAKGQLSDCGPGVTKFYDPARESVVLVHEYQHYVTDMITHMVGVQVAGAAPHIADVLHEGYSDYFGASQVTRVVGSNVTLVGEFFLQQCTALQRDIKDIQVYEDSELDLDPHYSGISWASGLWQFREDVGADTADKIALKSLFFLPTQPTSFDAVESLVKADREVTGGQYTSYLRDLYYNQIKFLGTEAPPFDPITKYIEVGFSGCSAAARPGARGVLWPVLILWLVGTVAAGRTRRRSDR